MTNDTTYITIDIKACNDAHLALSATPYNRDADTYEIVLGGTKNTKSAIRSKPLGKNEVEKETKGLMECDNYLSFWVSWSSGRIEVGKGSMYGEKPIMSWIDPNPHSVNAVSVATGWGSQGEFLYREPEGRVIITNKI